MAIYEVPIVLKLYWKWFLPAWLVLGMLPFALLQIANSNRFSEHLTLLFWLCAAPVLAVVLLPLIRLRRQKAINHFELAFGLTAGSLAVTAIPGVLYQAIAAFRL